MQFFVYNLFLLIFSPLILLLLIGRAFWIKQSVKSIKEQLGIVDNRQSNSNNIWIHAVSVGETVASVGVIEALKHIDPDLDIIFSTTSKSGHEQAEKSIKGFKDLIYYPYDFYFCVLNAIKKINPCLFASIDTEIWPNFRYVLRRHGVKSVIINGIISDGTLRGAKMFDWLYRWTLNNIDLFCMQSVGDAERVINLGANPKRVFVTGNCKADSADTQISAEKIVESFESFFPKAQKNAPVFVCGSTNPGEDVPVIEAYKDAKKQISNLKLIIAPRQIKRRDEIAALLNEQGLTYKFRSDTSVSELNYDVLILDTMGELANAYFMGKVSFVGGSLIKKGCHSILQPIAAGIGVCYGPYTFKAKDLVSQARQYKIGFEIKNSKELTDQIVKILIDDDLQHKIKNSCKKMIDANKGASVKTAELLVKLLKESKIEKDSRILYWETILNGSDKSFFAGLFRLVMYPFSLIYSLGHIVYLLPYTLNIRKKFIADIPVVSIGNITMGGTGKTPVTAKLVSLLKEKKISACILTRGYGRKSKNSLIIEPNSKELNSNASGDEPLLLSKLTEVPVIVGKDRRKSAKIAIEKYKPDVLVLDDGLQFWQMHRDLDIVIVDANNPFSSGLTVPSGDLREHKSALKRAGIILASSTNQMSSITLKKINKISPKSMVFKVTQKPENISFKSMKRDLNYILDKKIYAFCGIANPMRFIDSLASINADILDYDFFIDHHNYTDKDIVKIKNRAKELNAELIITTEKDFARMHEHKDKISNLCTLDISVQIEKEQELLNCVINAIKK